MCGHHDDLPPELDPWKNGMAQRYYGKRQFCHRPNSIGALPTEPEPYRLSL